MNYTNTMTEQIRNGIFNARMPGVQNNGNILLHCLMLIPNVSLVKFNNLEENRHSYLPYKRFF